MKKKIFWVLLLVLVVFLCNLILTGCDSVEITTTYNESGQIKVPDCSENFIDSNYTEAVKKFQQAGFKNIRVHYLNDTFFGLLVTENGIKEISINDVMSFDKNAYFDPKCVVFMTVHTRKPGEEVYVEEFDGQVPIMYNYSSLKDMDKLEAMACYQELGFTNITFTPIQDCFGSLDWNLNDVETVSVSGTTDYPAYNYYDKDIPINISYHTVKGDYCTNGLEHASAYREEKKPSCTECGWTAGTYCPICNKSLDSVEVSATGHTIVIDKHGYPATCISKGLSDESHCSACGETLSTQYELEIDSNNHIHVTIQEGTKATCISTGISDGRVCDDCGETLAKQEETPIDSTNHTNVVGGETVRPSNGYDGYQIESHCDDCGKTVLKGKTIPWKGSVEERTVTNELETSFPHSWALRAIVKGMCDYLDLNLQSHTYAYASSLFKVSNSGTWSYAGNNKWKFNDVKLYGGAYSQTYIVCGYATLSNGVIYLTSMNNGKSSNPSQYITYSSGGWFNVSVSAIK